VKILIELPTWLGDCVMATPAIENLLAYYPEAEWVAVGSPVSVAVFTEHPRLTQKIVLDKSYSALFKTARQLGWFDVFFSFRSSFRSRVFKYFLQAENKYQFDKYAFRAGHQVEKYNQFVNQCLGVNVPPGRLKIYLAPHRTRCWVYRQGVKNKSQRPLLGINPGASYGSAKRWYPEEFAKVAAALACQYDIVIFGGPGEVEIATDIEEGLKKSGVKNYQNRAGKTSIDELIDAIAGLDLMITGDSGPMHLAAAFQVPTVAVFGPTRDKETSQWQNAKSIIIKKDLPCQPCMKRVCPLQHHDCMRLIKAEDVLRAVKQLLAHQT